MLEKYIAFIKAHHTLVFLIGVFGTVLYIGHLWINRSYDTAIAKNAVAQQVLQEQVAKNAEAQKQQDARVQQYQALVDTLTKQNQTLVSGIVARNQAVATQQKTDASLPLSDLALRQMALAGTPGITSTESGLVESPAAAVVVTQKLESLPALEQNVKDQQTVITNKDSQIASINTVTNGLNDQVTGLKLQIVDAGKACDARVTEAKAVARKAKTSWFVHGLEIGAAIGAYLALHI
jgi:hypothetical protein